MTKPRYWNAFKVTARTISLLGEGELSLLMERLLKAQAYRCKAKLSEIAVNAEEKAKDGGSDGWSPRPEIQDDWLGETETCWQFKAGTAGQPAKIKGEVSKPIPSKTLRAGGRFVLVASGSKDGVNGQNARLDVLRKEASSKKIPTTRIVVMGSEQIASWCNQHPAIAASQNGLPDGLWLLEKWANSDVHKLPWHETKDLQTKLEKLQDELDLNEGTQWHVHIQGPPGVGKTRFVLELCRAAPWNESVVYFRQASDPRLNELIDSVVSDEQARLVVVADEVQKEQLLPLNEAVRHGQGRVRLVTIGLERTPDPRRVPAIEIAPLDRASALELVRVWFPTMPLEHRGFVAQFADGYTRLARLAAEAIMANPTVDLHDLLSSDAIKDFLDRMLGGRDRRALHVVAALKFVGWSDNREDEGKAIAEHLGLDWNNVRAEIEKFHRELGIAPQGGRFRYISPLPLGIYLALDAWETYPRLMETLDQKLPSEEARDAFYARMSAIAGSPKASHFVKEAMSRFFREGALDDHRAIRRWSALAQASPAEAVSKMHDALSRKSTEQRLQIQGAARRELVSALAELSWSSAAFHDGVRSLALLAEAENETWADNATEEFIGKFQVFLGGTATPYQERLAVIDELLDRGGKTPLALAAAALSLIGNDHESRTGSSGDMPPGAREPEWYPGSTSEEIACVEAALGRLLRMASEHHTEASTPLAKAAKDIVLLLRVDRFRPDVTSFLRKVCRAYPEEQEGLWRAVDKLLRWEQEHKRGLSAGALADLEALRSDLEDGSLRGRLRRLVGRTYSPRTPLDLSSLARSLVRHKPTIAGEWAWLTSGEAPGAWELGEALARAAKGSAFASFLAELPGRGGDLRVLCGFLSQYAADAGQHELEQWLDDHSASHPGDSALLVEISWRCGVTEKGARRLASILSEGKADPHTVGELVFGGGWSALSEGTFSLVLEALAGRKEFGDTALGLLVRRLSENPHEKTRWERLALGLLSRADLIQEHRVVSGHWAQLAGVFVSGHERAIASVLFRAHNARSGKNLMLAHGEAERILERCARGDPEGVWGELSSHLERPRSAAVFVIGFPPGIVEMLPQETILHWVEKDPGQRAPLVARMALKNLSSDETLAAQLLGRHGDKPSVRSAFLLSYSTGAWSGSAARHWNSVAQELENVARRTGLPKLRKWAKDAAGSIRRMAQEDQHLEEERMLRSG